MRSIALHASCSARNAFNTSSALRSTFTGHSRANRAACKPSSSHPACSYGRALRAVRCISTSNQRLQESDKPPDVHQILAAGRQDIQNADGDADATSHDASANGDIDAKSSGEKTEADKQSEMFEASDEDPTIAKWQMRMRKMGHSAHIYSDPKLPPPTPEVAEERRRTLEYEAMVIPPTKSTRLDPIPPPWELDLSQVRSLNGAQILSREIGHFARYAAGSVDTDRTRRSVAASIKREIDSSFGSSQNSTVFGSQRMGLAMVTSDIDFRLHLPTTAMTPVFSAKLKGLVEHFNRSKFYDDVTFIQGKFRMIRLVHRMSGLKIQIVAAPPTNIQAKVTANLLDQIPGLKSTYQVLHSALNLRGLLTVYEGGIGAYGLFVMTAAALSRRSDSHSPDLLLHVLDFYADFDPVRFGLSVDPPRLFKKHTRDPEATNQLIKAAKRRGDKQAAGKWAISFTRPYQPYLFCLQDPANFSNDLGRKSNGSKHLFATMRQMRDDLRRNVELGALVYESNPEGERSLLTPLLGRYHEVFAEPREKVESYVNRFAASMERRDRERGRARAKTTLSLEEKSARTRALAGLDPATRERIEKEFRASDEARENLAKEKQTKAKHDKANDEAREMLRDASVAQPPSGSVVRRVNVAGRW